MRPVPANGADLRRHREGARRSISLRQVNIDDVQEVPLAFAVRAIPTLLVLKDGKEVARRIGYTNAADLSKFLRDIPSPSSASRQKE